MQTTMQTFIRTTALVVFAWWGLAVSGNPALAQTYTMTPLATPHAGYEAVIPLRTSDDGKTFGFAQHDDGTRDYIIWLTTPSHGVAAGATTVAPLQGVVTSVLRRAGNRLAGYSFTRKQSYVWDESGGYVVLPKSSNYFDTGAQGINRHGVVVGWVEGVFAGAPIMHRIRGAVWEPPYESFSTRKPLPGHMSSRLDGINEHGTVVGTSFGTDDGYNNPIHKKLMWRSHGEPWQLVPDRTGVIWHGTVPFDLNSLLSHHTDWHITAAHDIDNRGRIVVSATDAQGIVRAFQLTPNREDFNGDGIIDQDDLAAFLHNYAQDHPSTDITRDGNIAPGDLVAFINGNWQTPSAQSTQETESGCETAHIATEFGLNFERSVAALGTGGLLQSTQQCDDPAEDHCPTLENPEARFCCAIEESDWEAVENCHDKFHPTRNPECYGCDWEDIPPAHRNPNNRDGKDGWPGDHELNPHMPKGTGGPGGNGGDGDATTRPGNGGKGGNGANGGNGGDGGNGGNATPNGGGSGGKGGQGGHGGSNVDGNAGNGGKGGDGGQGGSSGGGGSGGDGGNGGEATNGSGGDAGDGGNGAGGGLGGSKGGNGGSGGNATGDGPGAGGDGGKGGNGGNGPSIPPEPGIGGGGAGGNGGQGGQGSPNGGSGGAGGDGGNGGNGASGSNEQFPSPGGGNGGDGGNGGNAAQPWTPGSGGAGGQGGSDVNHGNNEPDHGTPGTPGNPGQPL